MALIDSNPGMPGYLAHPREYRSWSQMKTRCRNPNNPSYKSYGEKGITFCERWMWFENFFADMGERPHGTSLDRIDPYGNYEPDNCRWATQQEQLNNQRYPRERYKPRSDIGKKRAPYKSRETKSHQPSCLPREFSKNPKKQRLDRRLYKYKVVDLRTPREKSKPLRVLSLGAGVQSTALALLAQEGRLEAPDIALFADTGWEPAAVYDHLAKLERALPFPVQRVYSHAGKIQDSIAAGRFEPIPWFTADGAIGRRQCTKVYKLYPIRRRVRELLDGKTPAGGCHMLIGISTDEAHRMKPSTVDYITNTWPLIEMRWSRADCRAYLERRGWASVPRSACCGCPYLSDADWIARAHAPEWPETVRLSHALAATGQYMHRYLKPLDQIDFSTPAEKGQADLFGDDCEGLCGV